VQAQSKLTEEQIQARAKKVHAEAIPIDTHVDIPETWRDDPGTLTRNKCDLVKMKNGGLKGVFMAVYEGQPRTPDHGLTAEGYQRVYEAAMKKFDAVHQLAEKMHPELCAIATTPAQVEQIVMNLVVNARDAMPDGGKLTIETRNVRLDTTEADGQAGVQSGDYAMLAVSDTGCGMDAETQTRIFEPFFTTKALGRGTGLGLSTTYGIVKQSGGHISVESEPGRGAKFKIYLPGITDASDTMQPGSSGSEARAGRGTVLLVEDEPALRRMVRLALLRSGYTVLDATDGEAALQVAEHHQGVIHLLLTDVVMPRLGGPELAERLMQRRPEMKVLYVSGYAEAVVAGQGLRDMRVDFLQKPFATNDLVQKVGKLLGTPYQPPK
jgi:CheY-like chemotaxis protein